MINRKEIAVSCNMENFGKHIEQQYIMMYEVDKISISQQVKLLFKIAQGDKKINSKSRFFLSELKFPVQNSV